MKLLLAQQTVAKRVELGNASTTLTFEVLVPLNLEILSYKLDLFSKNLILLKLQYQRKVFETPPLSMRGVVDKSLPSTFVTRVQFLYSLSHVGWVCCWFFALLWEFFSGFSSFPPSTKTNTSKFLFDLDRGHRCVSVHIVLHLPSINKVAVIITHQQVNSSPTNENQGRLYSKANNPNNPPLLSSQCWGKMLMFFPRGKLP